MRYYIFISDSVKGDLRGVLAYDRRMLLDAIESQLTYAPSLETKKRTRLRNLVPPFHAIAPIWQLRVGMFRIFYDVNEHERRVYIRAIRRKPSHFTTEEIL